MIGGIISIIMFWVLQWNARSLVRNGQELKKFVDRFENKPEVICVAAAMLRFCNLRL